MALKNMIKLKDKVTFGRSGEKKVAGRVVKLNPKTAHIKCSNGDVMSVSYGLIQKHSSKKRKVTVCTPCGPKRLTAAKRKAPAKRNPSFEEWSRIQKGPPKGWSPKKATLSELYDYRGAKGTSASVRKAIQKELERRASGMSSGPRFDPMTGKPLKSTKRNHHDPKHNPANFTAKGERAYQHIKKGYGSDPRAKEIAARTVYTMAKTTSGLVKASTKRNPHGSFAMGKASAKRKAPTGGAYDAWAQKQNVTKLRQLEKAYKEILTSPSGMTLKNDARRKSTIIKKELRRRGK